MPNASKKTIVFAFLSATTVCLAADVPSEPLVKKGTLIFSDDFARTELGTSWRAVVPTFTVGDGVLKGSRDARRSRRGWLGKGRVEGRSDRVQVPLRRLQEHQRRLDGTKAYKGSHAGHICRITITPKLIRLGDDKEGGIRRMTSSQCGKTNAQGRTGQASDGSDSNHPDENRAGAMVSHEHRNCRRRD